MFHLKSTPISCCGTRCFATFAIRSDRDSLGNVPVKSAIPMTVPDPFLISAIRPLTRVSRERNSQVFFPERIKLIQGSFIVRPFTSAPKTLSSSYLPRRRSALSARVGKVISGPPTTTGSRVKGFGPLRVTPILTRLRIRGAAIPGRRQAANEP
jgi:hypothetical protein